MGPGPQKRKRRVSGATDNSIATANATLHYLMGSNSRMNRWKNMPAFQIEPRQNDSLSNEGSSPRPSPPPRPSSERRTSRSEPPTSTNDDNSPEPDSAADNDQPAQAETDDNNTNDHSDDLVAEPAADPRETSADTIAVRPAVTNPPPIHQEVDNQQGEDQTSNETAQVPSLPSPAPSESNEDSTAGKVKEITHDQLREPSRPSTCPPVIDRAPLQSDTERTHLPTSTITEPLPPRSAPPPRPLVLEQQNVAAQCVQPPVSPLTSRMRHQMTLDTPDSTRSASTWNAQAQSSNSQSPYTASTSVPSRPSTSHKRTSSRNTPFDKNVLESRALHMERDLHQQPGGQIEQSRMASLLQAIRRDDWFFIVLNQLYCLRSVAPNSLPEKIKRLGNKPFECLESLLAPNRGLKVSFLQWSSDFPRSIMDFYSNDDLRDSYNSTVEQIVFFLTSIERDWDRIRKECLERRVALLAQDMLDRLGIGSSILQGIYFRWMSRMLLGSTPQTTDILVALDDLHEADRKFCQRGLKRSEAALEQAYDAMVAAFADATSCSVQRRLFPATPSSPYINFRISPAILHIVNPHLHTAQNPAPMAPNQIPPLKAHDRFIVPSHGPHREPPSLAAEHVPRSQRPPHHQGSPMLLQQTMSPQLVNQPIPRMVTPGAPPMGSPRTASAGYSPQWNGNPAQGAQAMRPLTNGYPTHNPLGAQAAGRQVSAQQMQGARGDRVSVPHPNALRPAMPAPRQHYVHSSALQQHANGVQSYGPQVAHAQAQGHRQSITTYPTQSHQPIAPAPTGQVPNAMAQRSNYVFPRRHEMPRSQPMHPDSNRSALHQAHLRSPTLAPVDKEAPLLYRYVVSAEFGPHQLKANRPMDRCTVQIPSSVYQRLARSSPSSDPGGRSTRDLTEDSLSLRLRCTKYHPTTLSDWVTSDSVWPNYTYFKLNDKHIQTRLKLHYGRYLPVDITDIVKAGDNELLIAINRQDNEKTPFDFSVAVEAVVTVSRETIINKLTVLSAAESLRTIKRSLSEGVKDDDDFAITSSSLTIRMTDPISGTKACEIPVRGMDCRHRDCFDLDVFLSCVKRERSNWPSAVDVWRCPICRGDVRPDSLIRDDFLVQVRQQLAKAGTLETTRDIIVQADGQWRAKREDENTGVRSASLEREMPPNKRRSISTGVKRQEIEVVELD